MSLMKLIQQYDLDQEEYIRSLLKANAELETRNNKLIGLAVSGVSASDQMKLELALSGCLQRLSARVRISESDTYDINDMLIDNGLSPDSAARIADAITKMLNKTGDGT